MKERPILFSTEMVKAILEGRKCQTRRIIKPQPEIIKKVPYYAELEKHWDKLSFTYPDGESRLVNPKYNIGDVLWVKETFLIEKSIEDKIHYEYKSDYSETMADDVCWKPSIFMPKEATRLKLKVTNIRVERLQDITEEDAKNEGCERAVRWIHTGKIEFIAESHVFYKHSTYKDGYEMLWNKINGKGSWEANPWVWVIEFEKI